MTEGS